ncbi:protein ANTAGONIST OF LIKE HETEROCHROMATIN PROTEIN 1-like [Drosophila innubila]|uniref:protein ANTAGONIST OF LIKE HETEROCHROMATIN PROTEIN 1-like n=1 Tax=Drosophila innubila TaxID=198719 RepID=UPI00148CE05E|nr:protein ANTAGONIST OF LIKE HETEROCHROMATIN PROTEIN 1-like [Drosophila innubila]
MPLKRVKDTALEFRANETIREIELVEDVCHPNQIDSEIDEIMDDFLDDVMVIYFCRRGIGLKVPKPIKWRYNILSSFNDEHFYQMLRVSRNQFAKLVYLIKGDKVFARYSASHRQMPIELQLAIVLFRLGSSGGNASVRKIGEIFGVGNGGTVVKITERMFTAILRLMPQYIYWPDVVERQQLVERTFQELPHCVGYIGTSEIKLFEKPIENHKVYLSRQRIYSVKLQIICDHKLRIRDTVAGSPGSYPDYKIFINCPIGISTETYLSGEQWVAGDSAYPPSSFLVTPFPNDSQKMSPNKLRFNHRHSQYRARVQNCFELLKEKFSSLKEIRLRLKDKKSAKFLCEWILVCCVLHNILLEDYDPQNLDKELNTNCTKRTETESCKFYSLASESKREFLCKQMFA